MTFPSIFANVNSATGAQLDACLNFAGALGVIPCTAAGTNSLVLTLTSSAGPISAYQQNMVFSFVAANTNTGATTANPAGLGALNVYKDSTIGPAVLTGGEIEQGNYVTLAYDLALNSGGGGFHIVNTLAAGGSSGVSSVNGQNGAVTTGAAGFMVQAVDVYIQPTGIHSCFINPNTAGQIDSMAVGRTVPYDGSFSSQLKSISPVGSPTSGSLLTTFTSLNATSPTDYNGNREFLASIGLTVSTGQGVANGNGAKAALYVGTQCSPGTGGHNPGNTRGIHSVLQVDNSTGIFTVQGFELDLINNNASATAEGINVTFNASGGASFAWGLGFSTALGPAACNIGIEFAGGSASPILASGAAIHDAGTTGSTVLQIEGTHTKGLYFNGPTCTNGILFGSGAYTDAISFAGGTYTRGVGFQGGTYTYCVDTNGSTVSAGAIRMGNNQSLVARNVSSTADRLLMQLTTSDQINIGDTSTVNIIVGTGASNVFAPAIDNNTQCGFVSLAWGAVWSHAYNTVSDPSQKKDIAAVPSTLALLKAVGPISYAHKDDEAGQRRWGFDAKALHEAFAAEGHEPVHAVRATPEALPEGEHSTAMFSYDANALIATLWRQNQELLARLEALEARTP